MPRYLVALFSLIALPSLLSATDFDWLVREFSRDAGAKQVHVPFFGVARFIVAVSQPAGTTDLRLAIFERGELDPVRFRSVTDATVGPSWKPMIRVLSSRGEATNIYAREGRKDLNLLITSLDRKNATFVEVHLKPEALLRFVDEHDLR